METIDFNSLETIEIPVKIKGKDYVLREASGEAACKYRNKMLASTTMVDGKPSRIDGMADAEPLLVSLCLFDASTDVLVPLKTVISWPNRVQKKLYDTIKEISELDQEDTIDSLLKQREEIDKKLNKMYEEDASKNVPSGTKDGSS